MYNTKDTGVRYLGQVCEIWEQRHVSPRDTGVQVSGTWDRHVTPRNTGMQHPQADLPTSSTQ